MDAKNSETKSQVKHPTTSRTSVRLAKETLRVIRKELAKINNKKFGRRISANDFIAHAIGKMTDQDLEILRDKSLSSTDRLKLLYIEHVGEGGKLTREEFLGQVLEATIQRRNEAK